MCGHIKLQHSKDLRSSQDRFLILLGPVLHLCETWDSTLEMPVIQQRSVCH